MIPVDESEERKKTMSEKYRSRMEKRKRAEKQNKRKKATPKNKFPLWKKILITFIVLCLLLVTGGAISAAVIIQSAPELDPNELVLSQAAEIYDENDELVTRLQSEENRDLVDITEVPDHVKNAFIAVEDVRFYDHFGIDIKRVFGAIVKNITDGFGAEGASTITQQVVKNAFLTFDKTLTRKIQEQYLAIKLEQMYTKDQILEIYLNMIFFNERSYGIGEAASVYFNKEVSELTIEDAALLAAIPRRPSYYHPIQNPEAALKRRNMIIDLMHTHGFISEEDRNRAKEVTIEEQINYNPRPDEVVYDSFITQVQQEIEEIDGITTSDLYNGGLKIYTTLDRDAQDFAEEVIQTNNYISYYPDSEDFQVGFTLLDTKTGQIKAMVGNRQNQDVARGFNYAANAKASPGSTIKPIMDYGPAIEHHQWSTFHQIDDSPHTYSDGTPVRNYTRTHSGSVSMREALVRSINVPAVKALQATGLEKAKNFASGLGLPMEGEIYESAALGGGVEVSSLEMAGAYAAFGNNGMYTKPYAVRKIEFPDGRTLTLEPESKRAMSDYTAYMITDMLKDVVTRGTGTGANIPNLPLAGKTGTTNFDDNERQRFGIPQGGAPDVWFSGYTTQYTAAVWTGFSGQRGENYLIGQERDIAKEIFRLTMSHVSQNIDTPDFEKPDSVVEIVLDRYTGRRAHAGTPDSARTVELFVKGTGPEPISMEEETSLHEITGLQATYDEEADAIYVSWNYESEENESVTFQIDHRTNDGNYTTIQSQSEMQFTLTNPEKNATHYFRVTATRPDGESTSREVQVGVAIEEEETEEELEDEETDENHLGEEQDETKENGRDTSEESNNEEEPSTPPEETEQPQDEENNQPTQPDPNDDTSSNGNANDNGSNNRSENGNDNGANANSVRPDDAAAPTE